MKERTFHPDATPHDLLNRASEWLQYARGTMQLLADLIHEAESVDCLKLGLALEGLATMTRMGASCAAEAHARMNFAASLRVAATAN
jgi:hypothetical protein